MKRFRLILCLFAFAPLAAQQAFTQYSLGLSEAVLSNNLLWGFNRYIQQADYGMISLESARENLTGPWVWDQDEFLVNHGGHPYQGSIYYSAGRSAGNGFWRSASLTVFGSLSWELFMETETPSRNDLVVTTFGGVTLGEMLYRLSEVVRYGTDGSVEEMGPVRRFGSTLMSPYTGINKYFLKDRTRRIGPVTGHHRLGVGYSRFRVDHIPQNGSILVNEGIDLAYTANLEYGDPFTRGNKDPFDYFSLSARAILSYGNEAFFSLFSEGLLYGKTFYGKDGGRQNLGIHLNYDFIYNRLVNLGANGLGFGWLAEFSLGEAWHCRPSVYLNYIFLGASNIIFLKYNDIWMSAPDYERRNYSLSQGGNLNWGITLNRKGQLFFDLDYSLYNLYIIDSSVPENGEDGIEIIGMGSISVRRRITENFFVGAEALFYHKESLYDHYDSINERLWGYSAFYGFFF